MHALSDFMDELCAVPAEVTLKHDLAWNDHLDVMERALDRIASQIRPHPENFAARPSAILVMR
jgi:hypothetical protein